LILEYRQKPFAFQYKTGGLTLLARQEKAISGIAESIIVLNKPNRRLLNPSISIGRKAMAPGRIKSFHGSHKAQITCLNKINHANLVTPSSKFILLDNTNNEPKVTIHYPDESTASPSLFDARDVVKVSPFSIHSPKLNPLPFTQQRNATIRLLIITQAISHGDQRSNCGHTPP
jgi:hypothetical protein